MNASSWGRVVRAATATVFLSICIALPAWSQGYAGAGFGQASVDLGPCDLDITCEDDDTDTAFKIFGGYQVNPNLAIEVAYLDLGEAKANGTDTVLGDTTLTIAISGFNLAAVGSIPVAERFELLGKAGFFIWDLDARVTSSTLGSGSLSESGTAFMFGLGGLVKANDRVGVRLEWERFVDVGDEDSTGQSDIDLVSASLVIRF
jgi:OOP family OmpA-OmpF porin